MTLLCALKFYYVVVVTILFLSVTCCWWIFKDIINHWSFYTSKTKKCVLSSQFHIQKQMVFVVITIPNLWFIFVSQSMKDVSRLLKYSFIIPLKAKYVWQNMLAAREKSKRDGEFSFLEHDSEGEIFTTCKKMKLLYSYKLKQNIIVSISSISH